MRSCTTVESGQRQYQQHFYAKGQLSSSRAGSVIVSNMPLTSNTQSAVQIQGVNLAVSVTSACARGSGHEPKTHDVNRGQQNRNGDDMDGLHQRTNQFAD